MTASPVESTGMTAQLESLFAPWNRTDAPGLAAGVVHRGRILYRRGVGMASLESRVGMAPGTRVRIGSTSKHFAGLLALLLQEEGRFDLDAPIRTYLPELLGPSGDASSRLLLQHRGGMRCHLDLAMLTRGMATPPEGEALRALSRQQARNFAPGEAMIYSNGGYHAVSIALSRAGGAPFEDLLASRLFAPLGMNNSVSLPSDHDIVPGMATLHEPAPGGGWRRGLFPSHEVRGEGAIVSTVDDMIRWMAHLRARDRFGTARSWRQLTDCPVNVDGSLGVYALGLMVEDYRGLKTVHHAGGVFGGVSQMLTFPDEGLDIVILTNGAPGASPTQLAQRVADIVLADRLGPAPAKVSSATYQFLKGRWWSQDTGLSYDFTDAAGELKVAICGYPSGSAIGEAGPDRLRMLAGSIGEASFDTSGAVHGRLDVTFAGRTSTYALAVIHEQVDAEFANAAVGRFLCEDGRAKADIWREGEQLIARFGDPYGSIDVRLEQLGRSAAATTAAAGGGYHFAVLSFDADPDRFDAFRLNSARTRGLRFARVAA